MSVLINMKAMGGDRFKTCQLRFQMDRCNSKLKSFNVTTNLERSELCYIQRPNLNMSEALK